MRPAAMPLRQSRRGLATAKHPRAFPRPRPGWCDTAGYRGPPYGRKGRTGHRGGQASAPPIRSHDVRPEGDELGGIRSLRERNAHGSPPSVSTGRSCNKPRRLHQRSQVFIDIMRAGRDSTYRHPGRSGSLPRPTLPRPCAPREPSPRNGHGELRRRPAGRCMPRADLWPPSAVRGAPSSHSRPRHPRNRQRRKTTADQSDSSRHPTTGHAAGNGTTAGKPPYGWHEPAPAEPGSTAGRGSRGAAAGQPRRQQGHGT